jgi:hypothetical protein
VNSRALLLFATLLLAGCDTLRLRNAAGDAGILVDGTRAGTVVNDRSFLGSASGDVEILLGSMTGAAPPGRNEVVAFGALRRPMRVSTPWTDGHDAFALALADPVDVALTIWIVQGPFAAQRDHAAEACIRTGEIWETERAGMRIGECRIIDATADPDITGAILNSVGGDARNWDDFSARIGFEAGRVNVYWINTVEGATTWGWSDFGARIVMGRDTGVELLAHELGHALSLQHPAGCGAAHSDFDATNVMWPCSDVRAYLTEGQTFRAHFNASSAVNAIYGARPSEPTVACWSNGQTPECPGLERRLWSDGSFPAN